MPYGKSRWIDENGRSHNWSGEVASTNRNQVESQIRSQTGAKNVIIGDVYAEDPANYKNKRSKNASEERERFAEQERKLRSSGSSSGSYSSGGSSYSGLSTSNTDQFPWVAGIGVTINPDGKLIFTVP